MSETKITTQRLSLRDFQESDWEALLRVESDTEAVRYQSYGARTAEECRQYIARDIAARVHERWCFDLAVTLAESGRLIGRVGLDIRAPHRCIGELWFILDRAHWGHGLMPEAAGALVCVGCREQKLRRVFLECDPRNVAAIRLAEKLGMLREGLLREYGCYKGEWCDSLFYGLLAREWDPR